MKNLNRLLGYLVAAVVGGLLIWQWVQAVGAANDAQANVCMGLSPERIDKQAPDFKLKALRGGEKALASYKGRVLLLHFWFTQCPPCIDELPSLAKLNQSMAGDDFQLLTVSVDEKTQDVAGWLDKLGLASLPVLLDADKKVPTAYGTEKFPESYLIDRTGTTRYRFVNKRDWNSPIAKACIQSLL